MTKKKPKGDEERFPIIKGRGPIGLDTESFEPDMKGKGSAAFRDGRLVGISLACGNWKDYFPFGHEGGDNLDKDKVLAYVADQLSDPDQPKVGAHLIHDLSYLLVNGISVPGKLWDVQNAEALLVEDRFTYSLDAIAKDHTGRGKTDEQLDAWLVEQFGRKNPKANIWRAPGSVVQPYAADDAMLPLEIFDVQKPLLEDAALWDLFDMESRLIPMLLAMKARGVRVDVSKAEKMREEMARGIDKMLKEMKRVTGIEIQIWAADSIKQAFDAMGAPYPLTPKTKKPSFTAGFLENSDLPIAKMIVEARRMDKLKGTFLEGGILESVVNGRIHCQFNQLKSDEGGAVSGRFSSSNPNLQFIPVRTEMGNKIREMFIPDEGCLWWKKDWSQVEYRLIVHDAAHLDLKGAREVADRYHTDANLDFHDAVAELVFGNKEKDSRRKAKTINFGLAYGEGVDKLCGQLGLDRKEGEALINEYHRRAPFIKKLMTFLSNMAASKGEIRTLLNRRRTFNTWELRKWSKEKKDYEITYLRKRVPGARRAFTHKALNARIQGSAADLMKKAMVEVWESGVCSDLGGVPQLTVHDELDGSKPKGRKADKALAEITRIMENVAPLRVPLKVDSGEGINWGVCK